MKVGVHTFLGLDLRLPARRKLDQRSFDLGIFHALIAMRAGR